VEYQKKVVNVVCAVWWVDAADTIGMLSFDTSKLSFNTLDESVYYSIPDEEILCLFYVFYSG
jgi:hypothetical protein